MQPNAYNDHHRRAIYSRLDIGTARSVGPDCMYPLGAIDAKKAFGFSSRRFLYPAHRVRTQGRRAPGCIRSLRRDTMSSSAANRAKRISEGRIRPTLAGEKPVCRQRLYGGHKDSCSRKKVPVGVRWHVRPRGPTDACCRPVKTRSFFSWSLSAEWESS